MNFTQFLQVLRARKAIVLTVFFVVVGATTVVTLMLPKRYTAELVMSIDARGQDAVTGQSMVNFLTPAYLATQVDTITSHNVALKVVDQLGLANSPEARQKWEDAGGEGNYRDFMADSIRAKLEVKPSRDSNMITISYTSPDPHYASVIANAFGAAYQKMLIDIRSSNAQQNNDFFQQQLKGLKADMDRAQQRLTEFQQKRRHQCHRRAHGHRNTAPERSGGPTGRSAIVHAGSAIACSWRCGFAGRAQQWSDPEPQRHARVARSAVQTDASQQRPQLSEVQGNGSQVQATRDQLNQLLRQYSGSVSSVASNSASRQAAVEAALAEQKARVMDMKKTSRHHGCTDCRRRQRAKSLCPGAATFV